MIPDTAIIIGPVPPPYHGVTVYMNNIINSDLLRKKFNIIHLDTSDHRDLKNLGMFDFKNIYLAILQSVKYFVLLLRTKPHLVYIPISQNYGGYLRDGLFIILTKMFSSAKIVAHLHGSYFKTFYKKSMRLFKIFINFTIKKVYKPVVLGNNLRHVFSKWFERNNISVLPNGTELNPDTSKKRYSKENSIKLGYLSNLIKEKGIFDALKALKILKNRGYDVKLKIAGEWDLKFKHSAKILEKYIKENDLEFNVEFNGVVIGKEKVDFLLDSDIFVFPSYYLFEGHPLVIIEAMAAGCPVISTNIASIPETVIHGENGFLVEPKASGKMAENIEILIKNGELRKKMGLRSRQIYEEKYTLETNIKNMIGIFNNVLKKKD